MSRPLAEEVADRFDLGPDARLESEAARGEQGQVRRLVTARGTFALKQSFEEVNADEAQRTGEFQARCHGAGASCPRPLADVDGRFLGNVGGQAIRVQTWVDIDGPDPRLDPAAVGAELAALHQVVVPAAETPHPWHTEPVGAAEWQALVQASRDGAAPFAGQLAALVPALVEAEQLLTPMAGVQWCHLDLWADNVRGTPDGRACVIDFDNAGPGDPSRELAMVLFEFGRTDRARFAALVAAYESAGGAGRVQAAEDFGLTIAQLHHIGRYQVLRWLDARDAGARARAHAGVREFLDDPFLVPDVERLVRWAS